MSILLCSINFQKVIWLRKIQPSASFVRRSILGKENDIPKTFEIKNSIQNSIKKRMMNKSSSGSNNGVDTQALYPIPT